MFAVSGPGILILSTFAVPSCVLLYVLWRPKKEQPDVSVLVSEPVSPKGRGFSRQKKHKVSKEPSTSPTLDELGGGGLLPALVANEASVLPLDAVALDLANEQPVFAETQTELEQIEAARDTGDTEDTADAIDGAAGDSRPQEEPQVLVEADSGAVESTVVLAPQDLIPPRPPTEPIAKTPAKAPRVKKARNKMATFPFDVSVWDDPLSPRAMRRKQRRAERLEAGIDSKRLRSKEHTDIAGNNTSPVPLHYDAVVDPSSGDIFSDVWAQASGAAAPDEVGKLVTERGASRGRRKAERESRALEKMTAKRKKKEEREANRLRKRGPNSEGVAGFPGEDETGFGGSAVLAGIDEVDGAGVSFVGEGLDTTDVEVGTWDVDFEEEDGTSGLVSKNRRGVKRAERESRALEKLTSKRNKAEKKAGTGVAGSQGSDDLTKDSSGVGENAVLAAEILETTGVSAWELAAQAEALDPTQAAEVTTWESAAGPATPGMGVAAVSAWDQAAESASLQGSVVEFSPQAITSSSDLLEMGAAIVIGDGPGQGGDAWFVPEGFDEYEEEPRRRTGRRRKRRDDDDVLEEAVGGGWTDGGVLVEADENIDFRAYDLPEPVPARASVMFGESE